MRARHRSSKLLLRQGIVYYGGHAWTGTRGSPSLTRRGHASNQLLHQRWLHFSDRKKKAVIANVATAGDLRVLLGV